MNHCTDEMVVQDSSSLLRKHFFEACEKDDDVNVKQSSDNDALGPMYRMSSTILLFFVKFSVACKMKRKSVEFQTDRQARARNDTSRVARWTFADGTPPNRAIHAHQIKSPRQTHGIGLAQRICK